MARMRWTALVALMWSGAAEAGKTKVQHTNVVAPRWSVESVALDIGLVTHMKSTSDSVVVAGQRGVARIDASGAVLWTVELPEVMVRNVAVDEAGIAWTGWSLVGIEDKGKALNAWAAGKLLDKKIVEDATVGAVGLDGTALWTVPAKEQRPLSPPGLTAGTVGVMTGESVATYQRTDGAEAGSTSLKSGYAAFPGLSGVLDHGTRGEVVAIEGNFFTSFFSMFFKVSSTGSLIDKEAMAGLTPYANITCGPVQVGELLVFGNTGDSQINPAFFAMKPNMKNKWKAVSPDTQSGCGDLEVVGDTVYAASNFYVMAIDGKKGKVEWASVNKKGGLYPSANRGVRFIGNTGARKSYGDLMVVGGGKVFVAADNQGDVITVLDAEKGKYIETLDVKRTLVSMAVVGDSLVVATEAGLGLHPL